MNASKTPFPYLTDGQGGFSDVLRTEKRITWFSSFMTVLGNDSRLGRSFNMIKSAQTASLKLKWRTEVILVIQAEKTLSHNYLNISGKRVSWAWIMSGCPVLHFTHMGKHSPSVQQRFLMSSVRLNPNVTVARWKANSILSPSQSIEGTEKSPGKDQ